MNKEQTTRAAKTTCRINKHDRQRGFTLIELSLAILFIAFILVFLATTLLNIMAIYNKGIWISQINQASRQLNTDLADQARFAGGMTYLRNNNRICVGGISYLWNVDGEAVQNRFNDNSDLNLVRIVDPGGTYCKNPLPSPPRSDPNVSILLVHSDSGAAVLRFDVTENNRSNLIGFDIVISTTGSNRAQLNGGVWQCFEGGAVNQYCAFTEMNFYVFRRSR